MDRVSEGAFGFFVRLTMVADDFGRFDADPSVLQSRCYPLRAGRIRPRDVERYRDELVEAGTIELYEIRGVIFGHFPRWFDHQRKRDDRNSKFPAPDDPGATRPILAAKGGRKVPQTETETKTRDEDGAVDDRPAEAGGEAPLNGHENGNGGNGSPTPEDLSEAWNRICVPLGMPAVRDLTEARREKCRMRLRKQRQWEFWNEVFARMPRARFLQGENEKGWKADFDWFIRNDEQALRIVEGRYDHGKRA